MTAATEFVANWWAERLLSGPASWAATHNIECPQWQGLSSKTAVLVQWLVLFPSLIIRRSKSDKSYKCCGKMLFPYWNSNQSTHFKAASAARKTMESGFASAMFNRWTSVFIWKQQEESFVVILICNQLFFKHGVRDGISVTWSIDHNTW